LGKSEFKTMKLGWLQGAIALNVQTTTTSKQIVQILLTRCANNARRAALANGPQALAQPMRTLYAMLAAPAMTARLCSRCVLARQRLNAAIAALTARCAGEPATGVSSATQAFLFTTVLACLPAPLGTTTTLACVLSAMARAPHVVVLATVNAPHAMATKVSQTVLVQRLVMMQHSGTHLMERPCSSLQ
jgi:hypothetical protein